MTRAMLAERRERNRLYTFLWRRKLADGVYVRPRIVKNKPKRMPKEL